MRTQPSPAAPGVQPAPWYRELPQLLDSVDRFIGACGLSPLRLSVPDLVELAARRAGLTDYGESPFEEALRVLMSAYEEEANLSAFGRMAARWDVLRFLSNLLLLRSAEKQNPAILDQPIERPIFITGLPRSGTTFLHNLFCQDPSNFIIRCWETIYPCIPGDERLALPEARAAKVDRHLNAFARLAPNVRKLHPMTARSPQECTEVTAHIFQSLRFDTTHHIPSYRRWLDETGHLAAYRFHRRFLQHLQHDKGRGRWILKCPDHVFALDAIRAVYPDARFIFTHRNPLEVLPSVAELTEALRRPFTRRVDRQAIGRQVSEHWALGAEILVAAAANLPDSPDVAHLEFRALVEDPIRTMEALYDRFGLSFSDALAMRLRGFIAGWPNGGYRRDKPLLEEYGIGTEAERSRYRDYITCFGF